MRITIKAEQVSALQELNLDSVELTDKLREIAGSAAEKLAAQSRSLVKAKAKRRTGTLESVIGHFSYANAVGAGAYVGWERKSLRRKASSFQDANGRVRKVSTVADVGGILEYSGTRQLRHIQPAYQAMEDELTDYIESEIDKLLDRAGL